MSPKEVAAVLDLDDRLTMYGRCECGEVRAARETPSAEGDLHPFCPAGCELPASLRRNEQHGVA